MGKADIDEARAQSERDRIRRLTGSKVQVVDEPAGVGYPIAPILLAYITAVASLSSSGYVIAQTFSRFGSARFGQNIFGAIAAPPASIPTMPVPIIALSAVLLTATVYLIRPHNTGSQS